MSVTFSYDAASVELPEPQWGYSSIVNMAIKFKRSKSGDVISWDNGISCDYRTCSAKWLLTKQELADLHTFLNNANGGRLREFVIVIEDDHSFFPFGPDISNNSFLAYEIKNSRSGRQVRLFNRYFFEADILCSLYGTQDYSQGASEGELSIGPVLGLPFPACSPVFVKTGAIDITNGGLADLLDNGITSSYTDTELTIETNQGNVAALVYYLQNNVRSNPFTINTPENSSVFGAENGDGEFIVKLADNKIKVEHGGFELFKITLRLTKV